MIITARLLTVVTSSVGGLVALTGCLADPPEFEAPARVPPVVAAAEVEPALSRIIRLEPGVDRLQVSVPFRSEDLGSPILGAFLLDAEAGARDPRALKTVEVGASSFEDDTRAVDAELTGFSRVDPGCHSLTLMLTHRSNTDGREVVALDDSEATRIVWWLLLPFEDEDQADVLLEDCPVLTLEN